MDGLPELTCPYSANAHKDREYGHMYWGDVKDVLTLAESAEILVCLAPPRYEKANPVLRQLIATFYHRPEAAFGSGWAAI